MKKLMIVISISLIILLINSCNGNPFMTNLFSGIDNYNLPDSFESAEDILNEAGDDGFLDALADDPDLAEVVIDILDDVLTEDPAEADQDVALLLADVHLATSNADETVNNVNDLLVDAISDPESLDFDSPEDIITDLFALDQNLTVEQQEAAVSAQLEAFLGTAEALEFYGDTMIAGQDTSPEVNVGETAATAMISGMTSYMISNMDVSTINPAIIAANPTATDEELAILAMTDSIVNNTTMPDMLSDPAVDDAETTEEMLNAMLGDGLAEVVGDGFDLSAFEEMGV